MNDKSDDLNQAKHLGRSLDNTIFDDGTATK